MHFISLLLHLIHPCGFKHVDRQTNRYKWSIFEWVSQTTSLLPTKCRHHQSHMLTSACPTVPPKQLVVAFPIHYTPKKWWRSGGCGSSSIEGQQGHLARREGSRPSTSCPKTNHRWRDRHPCRSTASPTTLPYKESCKVTLNCDSVALSDTYLCCFMLCYNHVYTSVC